MSEIILLDSIMDQANFKQKKVITAKKEKKPKKERKPRSDKQKENDIKLKEKFKSYHENKKAKALYESSREVEQESDTQLLINNESIKFPSVDDMVKNIEKHVIATYSNCG